MKSFKINSVEFIKSINVVASVVKEKTTLPILLNLLFEINKDVLKITAYNQEIRASISIGVECDKTFSFCVSKQLLSSILSSLPSVDILLTVDKNEIQISSSFGVHNLPIEDSKLFPSGTDLGEQKSFKVDTEQFLDGLKKAVPFVDNATENLNGVLVKSVDNQLNIVGISNICFYEKGFPYNGDDVELILSSDSAKYLSQTIDADADLSINYNETLFSARFENISIDIIQLNIKFPNYKKIMDSLKKENYLKIKREGFLACVKRFSAISDKENKFLIMNVGKEKVNITYENDTFKHRASEDISDYVYDGKDIEFGMNISKLKLVLATLEDDVVNVFFSTSSQPILLTEENTRILFSLMKAR